MCRSRPSALFGLAVSARQTRLPFPPTSTHPRNSIAPSLPIRGAPRPGQPTFQEHLPADKAFARQHSRLTTLEGVTTRPHLLLRQGDPPYPETGLRIWLTA